jgi:cobalt transporter subunit CbtB
MPVRPNRRFDARTEGVMLRTFIPGLSIAGIGERHLAALLSALLGLVFIAGVGFASPDIVHGAAHDTRHAFTFPCH